MLKKEQTFETLKCSFAPRSFAASPLLPLPSQPLLPLPSQPLLPLPSQLLSISIASVRSFCSASSHQVCLSAFCLVASEESHLSGLESKFRIMDVKDAGHPQMKSIIVVEGSATEGCAAPHLGLFDIGVSDKAYLFRVSLSGVRKDSSNLKCTIDRDGSVHIQGFMTEGDVMKSTSKVYKMLKQQLCPPGEFTLSFNLPGPVDGRLFYPTFRPDGILEGVVMKERKAGVNFP